MNGNSGGRFRAKKVNFSMVSNEILRDDEISLKAKGLYSLIQSYITLENFVVYKGFLLSKCNEGKKSFETAWQELKAKGYLIQYRMQDEKKHFYYEYELLDTPIPQKGDTDSFPVPQKGYTQKGVIPERDDTRKGGDINNTELTKTDLNNTESIISIADVRDQIGADAYQTGSNAQIVENVAVLIHEVLTMPDNATLRINANIISAKNVKPRFKMIRFEHLDYILLALKDYTASIGNYRNFMLTVLFNSVGTVGIYFQNRINHDFYG